MEWLKNFDWSQLTPWKVIKIVGLVLVALLLLTLVLQIVGSSFRALSQGVGIGGMTMGIMPSSGSSYGEADGGGYAYDAANYAREESALMPQLSVRNVAGTTIYPPQPGSPAGDDAEAYEVTQYSASIETRKLEETCAGFDELKSRSDVVFDSAYSYDRGCSYVFKVAHASVEEVLEWLRDLDPKELSENTYTIKRQIDDFTSEVEILQKKRASIDETLTQALSAYSEITALATRTQNVEALTQIINSRIAIIERLTQERININEHLDRLARAKADQLDRLDYTYFSVDVREERFVDGEQLTDSWKQALRDFTTNVNKIVQDLTINLVFLFLLILQWALYALIALLVVKYGWRIGKHIWYR